MSRFLLGTHQPGWLGKAGVSLMVCDRRLRVYRRLPVAAAPWALDSGGFTELQQFGRWTVGPAEYAGRVRRYRDAIGGLTWAAPQDWMCEPIVIAGGRAGRLRFAGTGLTVAEHQRRTVASLVQLRALAPDVWWLPVLQGYTAAEYLACADLYAAAGIDLTTEPLTGLGSVCRRRATGETEQIITAASRSRVAPYCTTVSSTRRRCRAAIRRTSRASSNRSRRNASTLTAVGKLNTASIRNPRPPGAAPGPPHAPPPAKSGARS